MKKIICLFAFVAALASCRKRDVEVSQPVNSTLSPSAQVSKGEVKFGFEIVNTNSGANPRLEAADLKQIMVTIEDDKGVVVANKVTIDLILFNGSYISKPLVLGNGNYVLKEFLVLDAQSTVQYATPTAGSALAYLVQTALPQSFTVAKDKLTNMIPQVVNVANKKAGDFGYLSFNFTVVETLDFNIAVFAFNTTTASFDLIASEVTVKNGTTQMFKGTVPAAIEAISILDEKVGTYTLEVAQTGYKTFTNTYTYDALKAALKDPINVVLEEAPLTVGVTFQGGVIAYIFENTDKGYIEGEVHGIIAAPNDQSNFQLWGSVLMLKSNTGALDVSIGAGKVNTNKIMIYESANNFVFAARLCDDLVLSGYSDWFLPSLNELEKLYINRELIGGFETVNYTDKSVYWSSTEVNFWDAFSMNFGNGNLGIHHKNDFHFSVRAIRYF